MAELRELAMASGVEILTRKGKGYQLQVLEPQLYEPGPGTASNPFQHDELHQE